MPADGATLAVPADDVARLYDLYGTKIYRYCLGRLRSKEDAEDARQNTFLRVYAALRQGTVPAYEAAWLYKIAHNVCLSRVESAAARSRVETPRDLAALEAELAAPSSRRDELFGLETALAELPANLRQAILLREWQGLSYAEVADELGVSVSAVEALIFRARRRLAELLEQGVAQPARRGGAALNLSWLGSALRSLLGGAGPAKLAVAAALVAAGGGGLGTGLVVGLAHADRRPAAPAAAQLPPRAASTAATRAAAAGRHHPRHPARASAGAAAVPSPSPFAAASTPAIAPASSEPTLEPGAEPATVDPAAGTASAGAGVASAPAARPTTTSTTAAATTSATTTSATTTVPSAVAPTTVAAPSISSPSLPAVAPPSEPVATIPQPLPTTLPTAATPALPALPDPGAVATVPQLP